MIFSMTSRDFDERPMTQSRTVGRLRACADLLEAQEANTFRVCALRAASTTLDQLDFPISIALAEAGCRGLTQLPTIGPSSVATNIRVMNNGQS